MSTGWAHPAPSQTAMLYLYQSNRLELLARILAEQLRADPLPVLTCEQIAVAHPALAQWLARQLSDALGIVAQTSFPLPAALLWELLDALETRPADAARANRFTPEAMTWAILDRLPGLLPQEGFEQPRRWLADKTEGQTLQFAQRLARCLDRYLVFRPDWIQRWEAGQSATRDDQWQAELWRAMAGESPDHWVRLAARVTRQLGGDRSSIGRLPRRVSLFGVSSLSPGYLELLQQLAEHLDIHLYLLNPSRLYWADSLRRPIQSDQPPLELDADTSELHQELYPELENPLLAALCQQGRQLFAAVAALQPEDGANLFVENDQPSLLAQLQNDLLNHRDGRQSPFQWTHEDRSLRLHSCHGPLREVEVLHDQLLDRFATSDLQPSEVLVLTPDLNTYAPLLQAVFSAPGDRPRIPWHLGDYRPPADNRLAEALMDLLDTREQRLTLQQVAAWLEIPAIARRYGLEGEQARLIDWLRQAGVRWGRDATHRAALGLPAEPAHTWRSGIERLLLGHALADTGADLFEGLRPQDAVEGQDAVLLGGLLEFLDDLFEQLQQTTALRTPEQWVISLQGLIERFTRAEGQELIQLQRLRDALQAWLRQTQLGGFDRACSSDLLLPPLRASLAADPPRGRAQGVSCGALSLHRMVPARLICLIGMNDGVFPRTSPPLGFDLVARRWRFGDRSGVMEDRYLFLELLTSVREALLISWSGQDQRDNSSRPPSILVSELLDYLDGAAVFDQGKARDNLVLRHPLQPFSPRYFGAHPELFSYSASLARALTESRGMPLETGPPLARARTGREPLDQIELSEFERFLAGPTRWFCEQRLAMKLPPEAVQWLDDEPLDFDFFEGHELNLWLVERLRAGRKPEDLIELLRAGNQLPHGNWGLARIETRIGQMQGFAEQLRDLLLPVNRRLPFELDLGVLTISGSLTLTATGQQTLLTHEPWGGTLPGLWLRHLVLQQLEPGAQTEILHPGGKTQFNPVPEAERYLAELVDMLRAGSQRPLPFFPKSARAYVEEMDKSGDEEKAISEARKRFLDGFTNSGEFSKPWHAETFEGEAALNAEFGQLATSVWAPLLEHLE